MATESKLDLEVVYEGDERVSDNSEKFIAAHFDKDDNNVTYKMYGNILNVTTDDGAGRKSISTFTAKRIDQVSKPATTSASTATKK